MKPTAAGNRLILKARLDLSADQRAALMQALAAELTWRGEGVRQACAGEVGRKAALFTAAADRAVYNALKGLESEMRQGGQ